MTVTPANDPYSNQGDSRDTPARQKLVALRTTLLKLHKSLLDMERREYEKVHGKVNVGELFRLVVGDAQFAWLHSISEFVVRIDEMLAGEKEKEVTDAESHEAVSLARKMFLPSETGDAFQKQYFDALQRDPDVVMEHAELARLFSAEPLDPEA
jgi:hypothetical protein